MNYLADAYSTDPYLSSTSITSKYRTFDWVQYPQQITITDLKLWPLKCITNLQVKSIKFDKKFTTVTWNDGTTTRVGCMLEDEYNKYEAFCAALAKRIYGSTSSVKHIVDTKDEQIEIDKQRKEREAQEKAAQIRKARKDRIWIKKRAKEIARENAAQELAKKITGKNNEETAVVCAKDIPSGRNNNNNLSR